MQDSPDPTALFDAIKSLASPQMVRDLMARIRLQRGYQRGQVYMARFENASALYRAMQQRGKGPDCVRRVASIMPQDFAPTAPPELAQQALQMDTSRQVLVAIGFNGDDQDAVVLCFGGVFEFASL